MTTPLTLFAQGKLAMAVGSNYFTGNWTKFIGAPYWAQAAQTMAVTPIPTQSGGGIASTLGGWDYAISAHSGNPDAAFKLINVMENEQNSIDAANWAGWVTPNKDYWTAPAFTKFAPVSVDVRPDPGPRDADPVVVGLLDLGAGNGQRHRSLVQNPSTSVNTAVNTLSSYVSNQLGG